MLTVAAMFLYRGGSRFDVDARHYQFFGNFFSDLGATVTYSGRADTAPRALFVTALVAGGPSRSVWSGPIWAVRRGARASARRRPRSRCVLDRLHPIGFIGIGVTPVEP